MIYKHIYIYMYIYNIHMIYIYNTYTYIYICFLLVETQMFYSIRVAFVHFTHMPLSFAL